MNRDIILKVDDLRVDFFSKKATLTALHGVSFEVARGETLGIVGESGCGKSVTANAIMRLLPVRQSRIRSGSILFSSGDREIDIADLDPTGRQMRALRGNRISMIFQDPMSSLNPVYKVGSQVLENLLEHESLPKKRAQRRIVELMQKLGIPNAEDRMNDYPHQFSGGMKQRVVIAIAMICNPELLIADEPTTALDVTIQAQILELMRDIQRETGTSIILITHNMGIIVDYADHVAVMYMGRIVEQGRTKTVFQNPCHPYTKALLRSVPVPGMKKGERLQSIEGSTPDLSELPEGCAFWPRCPQAHERCRCAVPGEILIEEGHTACCHLFGEGDAQ